MAATGNKVHQLPAFLKAWLIFSFWFCVCFVPVSFSGCVFPATTTIWDKHFLSIPVLSLAQSQLSAPCVLCVCVNDGNADAHQHGEIAQFANTSCCGIRNRRCVPQVRTGGFHPFLVYLCTLR